MSDEEIQKYIEIFQNFSNESNDIVNEAASEISQIQMSLIPILATVFIKCDDINVKRLAIKSIQTTLTSHSDQDYVQKCDEYKKNPVYSNCIKDISWKALQINDPTLRNFTTQLLSLVIGIEKEDAQELVVSCVNALSSESLDELTSACYIDIFNGVLNLPNFSTQFTNPNFYPAFFEIFRICQLIISKGATILNDTFTISACNYILSVIDFLPLIIDKEEIVKNLLISFEKSLIMGKVGITNQLHLIMFALFKKFYTHSESFMEIIFEYTKNNIMGFTHLPQLELISINFWKEVAQYEKHLKNPIYISGKAFPELVKIFFDILNPRENIVNFNPSQVFNDEDEAFINPLYDEANQTIIEFSKVIPDCVFSIISNKIDAVLNPFSGEWQDIVFALGLFYSISSSKISADKFIPFFWKYWNDFIMPSIKFDVEPLIRELAFLIIRSVLDNFPCFITDMADFYNYFKFFVFKDFKVCDIDDQLLRMVKYMEISVLDETGQTVEFDPKFCTLYARVIDSISKLWKNNPLKSRLYFCNTYFQIQSRINDIFHFGIQINSFPIIRAASVAISHLIEFAYKDDTNGQCICEWYQEKIKELEESSQIMDIDLRNIVKSNLCYIIGSFILKIGNFEIIAKNALELLFDCLNMKNFVFDDASDAVKNLIIQMPQEFYTHADYILQFCLEPLTSQVPSSINSACLLISALFNNYFEIINEKVVIFLERLITLFQNNPNATPIHKTVLTTIGSILSSPSQRPYTEFNDFFLTQHQDLDNLIYQIIRSIETYPIYYKNIEYDNDYFQGILKLYKGYCLAFMYNANIPQINDLIKSELNKYGAHFYKREKDQILLLYAIARKIFLNINLFHHEVIFDFYDAFEIIILRCSKKNNIKLRLNYFTGLLDYSKYQYEDKILEKIKKRVSKINKLKEDRDK